MSGTVSFATVGGVELINITMGAPNVEQVQLLMQGIKRYYRLPMEATVALFMDASLGVCIMNL